MKIAQQSMLVVLACVLGGLLTSVVIGIKSYQLQSAHEINTDNLLLLRDVKHEKLMLSQWFITIDLYFSQKDSYLQSGINIQAKQLLNMLNLKKTQPLYSNPSDYQEESLQLQSEIQKTSKALYDEISLVASLIKSSDIFNVNSTQWKNNLVKVDALSSNVIILLNDLEAQYQQLSSYSQQQLDDKKSNIPIISISTIFFLFVKVFLILRVIQLPVNGQWARAY